MRIRIDFADAKDYIMDNVTEYITNTYPIGHKIPELDLYNLLGKEIERVLIEDYFNGADKAVLYIGFSLDCEYFEFDLMSNT